jgi:Tol biopolymer transport system component
MARKAKIAMALATLAIVTVIAAMVAIGGTKPWQEAYTVPHAGKYGIYALDLATNRTSLLYSTNDEIFTSALRLNVAGDSLVFAQKVNSTSDSSTEIFTLRVEGGSPARVTANSHWDLYPAWSPNGSQIAFLSKREGDLDIYVINSDGSGERRLYDSGTNDADIDWRGGTIVFTSNFTIWRMDGDGTQAAQVTQPQNAGIWGTANLPIGDYDPRLSPDGTRIAFERLEDPFAPNGGYNIFTIRTDGTQETRLTSTGFAQGLPSWSPSGERIAYVVAAFNGTGVYDIYTVNADGTGNGNATPSYFPTGFLCYSPAFSKDASKLYFIGQWSQ